MTASSEQRAVSSKRIGDKRMIRAIFVFVYLMPAVFLPAGSVAQQTGKIPRIGMLLPGSLTTYAPRIDAFREGLRDLGYVEGKTIH
jgi:putative ABC transport system substrate-binding protein